MVQVNSYCHSVRQNLIALTKDTSLELNAFNPKLIIIIGNYEKQLDSPKKRESFELFRGCLSAVEVITFDEFFRKVEYLAKLFNLVRSAATTPAINSLNATGPT